MQPIIHNTFVMERSYPVPPAKVFAAFSDPVKKRRWYGEGRSHDVEVFEMDFREGGAERVHYRFKEGTPFPGAILTNEEVFQHIVPDTRIMMASVMSLAGNVISTALATFEFRATEKGTDMIFTHHGAFLENSGGPEMREMGWKSLLDRLQEEIAR